MITYHTIRGQILARVPGIDLADIPSLLQMLLSTARGPEWRDTSKVVHPLAGLETLWVEEIADLQEAITAQQQDGLTHGLTEPETEADVMVSLRQEFMRGDDTAGMSFEVCERAAVDGHVTHHLVSLLPMVDSCPSLWDINERPVLKGCRT